MALSLSQKDVQMTDSWDYLLKALNCQHPHYIGHVAIEGLMRETYPAYQASDNPNSPIVAYIR